MLDRLMRRAVLAHANRVVSEYEHHLQFHQRRQSNRWPRVVGEAHETRSVWNEASVQRDTVEDRAHAMLSNSEMQIAAVVVTTLEVAAVLDVGEGRLVEIGGAAEQVPDFFGDSGLGLRG